MDIGGVCPVEIHKAPDPRRQAGEVVIEVGRCGIESSNPNLSENHGDHPSTQLHHLPGHDRWAIAARTSNPAAVTAAAGAASTFNARILAMRGFWQCEDSGNARTLVIQKPQVRGKRDDRLCSKP